jgi:acyl-CoA thioesterase
MKAAMFALRTTPKKNRALSSVTATPYLFDVDTAIVPVPMTTADTSTTMFRTAGNVSSNWSINNYPNGGYTMSMCISAAREVCAFRDTLTTTCHYLNPLLEDEPALFHSRVLKKSKTTATVEVACIQQDQERVRFTGTFGHLKTMQGSSRDVRTNDDGVCYVDQMPSVDKCRDDTLWRGLQALKVGTLYEKGIQVWVPEDSPFVTGLLCGKSANEPRIDAHVAFLDGRPPCLRSLALFNDCLPPAVLNWAGMAKWVPTIEYSCHTYRRPDPSGPLRMSFRADVIHNGVATINGVVKDVNGDLCSVSRQMCTIRV